MATSKKDECVALVRANIKETRKVVISKIMEALNMSDAGASTYYYNAMKTIKTEDALSGLDVKTITDGLDASTSTAVKATLPKEAPVNEAKIVAATKAAQAELPKTEGQLMADEVATVAPKAKVEKPAKAVEEKKVPVIAERRATESRQADPCAVNDMDRYIASIDINEIPLFLRKK